jgi:hypothetical protein
MYQVYRWCFIRYIEIKKRACNNLLIQKYIVQFCNITFISNNLPVVVDKNSVQLNTNPETMVISTALLTSLQMLFECFSLKCFSAFIFTSMTKIDSF